MKMKVINTRWWSYSFLSMVLVGLFYELINFSFGLYFVRENFEMLLTEEFLRLSE